MVGRLILVSIFFLIAQGCVVTEGDPVCGDGDCTPSSGESCTSCPADCGSCAGCGDGTCSTSTGESCASCPADCGDCDFCGDRVCDGGETCETCPGDCGSCETTCGPTNCGGCCDGDACVGGDSPSACGSGGHTCMVCDSAFTCGAGSCTVDPASRWNIVLETLTVESTHHSGAAWDVMGGAPDPLVGIRVGSDTAAEQRTGAASDTFSVTYDGSPTVMNQRADDIQTYVGFLVYDEDLTDYEFIGWCSTRNIEEAAFAEVTQTQRCGSDPSTNNSGFTLTWHLERY